MSKPTEVKDCFGEYGCRFGPEDHDPVECFTCPLEAHCFRMTVADAVTDTAANLSFLVNSLVENGTLKDVRKQKRHNGGKP